ncbi:MAG TPA: ECF-type sigma factor [Pirellulales bacterium]|jgi:RNA polymerase sigma factor (sigma-70 family)
MDESDERNAEGSISGFLRDLQRGNANDQAATKLWERYFAKIVALAKTKLQPHERRVSDEEDVAISVFDTLCRGVAEGRFSKLQGRHELWKLLVVITHHKIIDKKRRAARKKRNPESRDGKASFDVMTEFAEIIGREPTPESLVMMDEQIQRLLAMLGDDNLRWVAVAKMEGHTNRDIAARLGVSVRTIDRKLDLVQMTWSSVIFT